MKTAREWFEELPEPYRSQALENLTNNDISGTLRGALSGGFIWRKTPQGFKYWNDVWDKLITGKPLEPQPDLAQLVREYFELMNSLNYAIIDDEFFERLDKLAKAKSSFKKAVGLE